MPTINQAISANGDDGQAGSGAGFFDSGGVITLGRYFGTANGWFRFPSTGIPEGATITAATFTATRHAESTGLADLIFYGNKATSPTNPTSDSDYNAKAVTTASVTHDDQSGTSGTYTSPSLVSIIQELVDQSGFSGTIMLLIKDNGSGGSENRLSINARDGGSGNYATLNVTYEEPASGSAVGANLLYSMLLGGSC